jgi:DNA polymerase IV
MAEISTSGGLNLESCPAVFVLPTHLALEELHQIEEQLVQHHARLTYDISEAQLILGKIAHKKRAALELRSRGLWTEEIPLQTATSEPPTKRRRIHGETQARVEEVDLSTETEGEEDGVRSKHDSRRHLKKPPSAAGLPDAADTISVAKLEWFTQCLSSNALLPIGPYIVYQARKTARPPPPPSVSASSDILQRAKQDAAARRADSSAPSSSQRPPPKLYRQTTSENDEAAPLPPAPAWVTNHIVYACQRSAPLHPPNEGFIEQLQAIRQIRELTLDEVGVRAYSTSIAAIAAYPYEFRRPSEVLTLPGCDAKIAHLLAEYQASETRTLAAAKALTTDPELRVLHEFSQIWGVGPKTAREFYYARGWRDLDDIVEHGWAGLSRVQQIGVKYYDEFRRGIPRGEVEAIARVVHRHANAVRPEAAYDGRGVECILVGGYRRGKEISGDVDLILTHRDEAVTRNLVVDVVGSLEAEGWVTHTLALNLTTSARDQQPLPFRGESAGAHHFDSLDKALVVWQDPRFDDPQVEEGKGKGKGQEEEEQEAARRKRNPNPHRRVDIIISPWRTVGCAVLGWSGDTTFERDLRRYAKKMHGWKFDSSGVRERTTGGRVVDLESEGHTWEERERLVMEGLGVGWREPGERCSR